MNNTTSTTVSPIGGATVSVGVSSLGSLLQDLLNTDQLQPGDDVSYQMCKALYVGHPLGRKMARAPVELAMSEPREIAVPDGPEEMCVEAYLKAWKEVRARENIINLATQARVYGIASVAMGELGVKGDTTEPVDLKRLWQAEPYFNILDPLNTAGSLVTSQDPNSPLYQKWGDLWVNGQRYHRSRTVTMMNEEPLYIAWSTSAFGFVGRSVYQRAFYPMKSFLQSMVTDDLVTLKAGLIVARLEQVGSFVDKIMKTMFGVKRALLKQARTGGVLSIGKDELIETVNMRNVNEAMSASRENIIKNIATAADMPAKLLTQESFVEGFGEGTQDAYAVVQYINGLRTELDPIISWFDTICQYRAWNPEFYEVVQHKYPDEYGNVPHHVALYRWRNSFRALWPDLIKEKPSEAVDRDKVRLESLISLVEVFAPMLDPFNKAQLVQAVYDQLNTHEHLFGGAKFDLDADALMDHFGEMAEQAKMMGHNGGPPLGGEEEEREPAEPRPMHLAADSRAVGEVVRLMNERRRGLTVR